VCGSRQLQYRCTLTLAQTCKQYDLAVWKFQRIMMGYAALRINLPEAGRMRPWRQARPTWDYAAELILRAATSGKRADIEAATAQMERALRTDNWL
jgi:hypothetical protein